MDEIFGYDNFRDEIVWRYFMGGKSKRFFSHKHDVILFYSKTNQYFFNEEVLETERILPYIPSLKSEKGIEEISCTSCNKGSGIWKSKVKMDDVWDLSGVFNLSNEYLGYPTQKPETLLTRIIKASSNEADIVLDPFCGCGTSITVAAKLKRNFIGIDISPQGCKVMKERIKKVRIESDSDIIKFELEKSDIEKMNWFEFQQWSCDKLNCVFQVVKEQTKV